MVYVYEKSQTMTYFLIGVWQNLNNNLTLIYFVNTIKVEWTVESSLMPSWILKGNEIHILWNWE